RELLLGLGLERGGAFGARLPAAEGRHLAAAGCATRATLPADRGGGTRLRRRTTRQNRKLVRARARDPLGDVFRRRGSARLAFLHALAERVEAAFVGVDMGEVEALEIAHGELAEDVIEDRGRVFDRVVALHRAGGLEAREGEGVDVFL